MTRSPQWKPCLRMLETVVIPDRDHGRVLVLRDSQGTTPHVATIPPPLVPIVARFTGAETIVQIARNVSREAGLEVPESLVMDLAMELDRALLLEGPTYQAALTDVKRAFVLATRREAAHAGGAYARDPAELTRYLDDDCLGRSGRSTSRATDRRLVGLIAPHIDPWRGAVSYGHAYAAFRDAVPHEADTFLLFGTSHAPMREPFALCRKAFDTPLGALHPDTEAIDALAAAAEFDPYADQLNHKREHSLEFQAVFLKHLMGDRPARIVPILAGLGDCQASGSDPARDRSIEQFFGSVEALMASRPGQVVVIAGADMAHVGPRFGDERPFDRTERARLEETDRASLARAANLDAPGFWRHVARDLDSRRVCGLGPVYALLRSLGHASRGEVLHYEQTVDHEDGSIVSHAAVAFFG